MGITSGAVLAPLVCGHLAQGEGFRAFLAASLGSKLAGYLSGFFDAQSPSTLVRLYGGIAVGLLIAIGILAALIPTLRRLMGHVKEAAGRWQ